MKLSKLLLAGAFAVSAVSAYAADVTVRFTGSTAFRSSTVTAIKDWYTNNSATGLKIVYTSGSSLTGANQQGFLGTVAGKSYLIQCSWSGSSAGIESLANKSNPTVANFFTETAVNANGNTTGAALATSGNVQSATPDVAMGDSTQAEAGKTGSAYLTLNKTQVGVIPFVWVRGRSNESAHQTALNQVTNITSLQARSILTGFAPISLFTKNQADVGTYVRVVGRDNGSGTRLNAFLECGFGRDTPPDQYTFTVTGGEITALDPNLTPESGYSSGSNVRTGVITPMAAGQDGVVFGYMGTADAAGIPGITFSNSTDGVFSGTPAAQILAFNGVPYSHDAVRNGSYTFWNYEYLMNRSTLAGDALTAVNAIKNIIINADAAVGGIKLSTMNVERNGSGEIVNSKF